MDQRKDLISRGLWLEYATLGWNILGSAVVFVAAFRAYSVALAGFGLDSLIEIFASVVVVWQLKGIYEQREKKALRLIGGAFFLLAAYVFVQSIRTILIQAHPDTSELGIVWLFLTFAVMVALAIGKRRVGTKLENEVLLTEGRVTLVDAYLAGAVLVGLVLNTAIGWWWADPVAGFVIVAYGFK